MDFFGQNFWQTGGLKQKREAVRSPKSREVFNSRRENHMYVNSKSVTNATASSKSVTNAKNHLCPKNDIYKNIFI